MAEPILRRDEPLSSHHLCEWETELAFANGFEAGRAQAHAEIADALRVMVGGEESKTWTEAVERHHRAMDARARRHAVDTAEVVLA